MDNLFLLNIYPNPFNNKATISYHLPQDMGNAQLQIFNDIGQQLKIIALPQDEIEVQIDSSSLGPGTYHYSVFSKGEKLSDGKFIITK